MLLLLANLARWVRGQTLSGQFLEGLSCWRSHENQPHLHNLQLPVSKLVDTKKSNTTRVSTRLEFSPYLQNVRMCGFSVQFCANQLVIQPALWNCLNQYRVPVQSQSEPCNLMPTNLQSSVVPPTLWNCWNQYRVPVQSQMSLSDELKLKKTLRSFSVERSIFAFCKSRVGLKVGLAMKTVLVEVSLYSLYLLLQLVVLLSEVS